MPFQGFEGVSGFNWRIEMFSVIFVGIYFGVVGYILAFKTSSILRLIRIETTTIDSTASTAKDTDYTRLAFSIMGTFFAVPAFTKMLNDVITIWMRSKTTVDLRFFEEPFILKSFPDLIENAIKLLIGIALLLGADRLSQLWKRLRPLSNNDERG